MHLNVRIICKTLKLKQNWKFINLNTKQYTFFRFIKFDFISQTLMMWPFKTTAGNVIT